MKSYSLGRRFEPRHIYRIANALNSVNVNSLDSVEGHVNEGVTQEELSNLGRRLFKPLDLFLRAFHT